ncbi:MAG: GNAT family N-acetyltransferase [Nonomuraea sp.]|nr:GNAT family N-acetyltransferase [Nonomuraea sp.]
MTLRGIGPDDQDEFGRLVLASADLHGPWMQLPSTPEAFATYLTRFNHDTNQGLLVIRRDTGEIAGSVNINSIIRGRFQNASIGYSAFSPSAGRGYMTEGVALVVRYCFEQLRLHRLDAQIQPANTASLNLIARVGFTHEGRSEKLLFIDGEWRDHERFVLLAPHPYVPHVSLPAR